VAEEQKRDTNGDVPLDPGFQSANSAAVEAMVELAAKQERESEEKKLHPMFRRGSEDSTRSRSASIVEEKKPRMKERKISKGRQTRKMGKVEEEAIEIDLSDEDDRSRAIGPNDGKEELQDGEEAKPESETYGPVFSKRFFR
jgi:hypothetical protein